MGKQEKGRFRSKRNARRRHNVRQRPSARKTIGIHRRAIGLIQQELLTGKATIGRFHGGVEWRALQPLFAEGLSVTVRAEEPLKMAGRPEPRVGSFWPLKSGTRMRSLPPSGRPTRLPASPGLRCAPGMSFAGALGRLCRFWIGAELWQSRVHASSAFSTRFRPLSRSQRGQLRFSVCAVGIGNFQREAIQYPP